MRCSPDLAALNVCALVSSLTAGRVSDWIGRRRTISLAACIFLAGSVLMGLSPNFGTLLAGRCVAGVGVGYALMIAPVYAAEISSAQIRGSVTGFIARCDAHRDPDVLSIDMAGEMAEEYGTFFAGFIDADGNDKLRRLDEADPPSSPEFLFDAPDPPSSPEFLFNEPDPPSSPEFLFDAPDSPSSPEFQVDADWISQLIEISRQRLEFQKELHEENKNLAEKAVMDKSWKVAEVTRIAEQQMGITPDQVELWDGLYWLTKNESDMDFFLASTSEAGRKRIIVMNIPRKAG